MNDKLVFSRFNKQTEKNEYLESVNQLKQGDNIWINDVDLMDEKLVDWLNGKLEPKECRVALFFEVHAKGRPSETFSKIDVARERCEFALFKGAANASIRTFVGDFADNSDRKPCITDEEKSELQELGFEI